MGVNIKKQSYIKILTVMVVEIPLEMCCSLEKGIAAGRATEWYISDIDKLHNTNEFSASS